MKEFVKHILLENGICRHGNLPRPHRLLLGLVKYKCALRLRVESQQRGGECCQKMGMTENKGAEEEGSADAKISGE